MPPPSPTTRQRPQWPPALPARPTLEDLPPEFLSAAFARLDERSRCACRLVCRSWRLASDGPSTSPAATATLSPGSWSRLCLSAATLRRPSALPRAPYLARCASLALCRGGGVVSDVSLRFAAAACARARRLALDALPGLYGTALRRVACGDLVALRVRACEELRGPALGEMLRSCRSLASLSVCACPRVCAADVVPRLPPSLVELQLEKLGAGPLELGGDALLACAGALCACTALERLSLDDTACGPQAQLLWFMGSAPPSLAALRLGGWCDLSYAVALSPRAVGGILGRLRVLESSGAADAGAVVRALRGDVRRLQLSGCNGPSEAGVEAAQRFTGLTCLDVTHWRQFDPAAMKAVAFYCRDLRSLNVSYTSVDDAALTDVCQLRSLEALDISGCIELTQEALEHVLPCQRLVALGLAWLDWVDEPAVVALGALSRLRVLSLRHCLKASGVSHGLWPQMRELDLSSTKVSDSDLCALCAQCPMLRRLAIAHCRSVSSEGIKQLQTLAWLLSLDVSEGLTFINDEF
eukprot:m51a1_g11956 hypothetical protein (527) ;mRNA; r:785980-788122